jgi:hypothetical protein
MPMVGRTKCAVPDCGAVISGDGNLCDEHRLPGPVVHVGDSAMVIVAWTHSRQGARAVRRVNSGSRYTNSSKQSNRNSLCGKRFLRGMRLHWLLRKSSAPGPCNWRRCVPIKRRRAKGR